MAAQFADCGKLWRCDRAAPNSHPELERASFKNGKCATTLYFVRRSSHRNEDGTLYSGRLAYRNQESTAESKAKQSKAKQSKAKQSKAKQSKAKQSKAKQSKAKQSKAKQSKAKQSKAKQSKAKQSKASTLLISAWSEEEEEELPIEARMEQLLVGIKGRRKPFVVVVATLDESGPQGLIRRRKRLTKVDCARILVA